MESLYPATSTPPSSETATARTIPPRVVARATATGAPATSAAYTLTDPSAWPPVATHRPSGVDAHGTRARSNVGCDSARISTGARDVSRSASSSRANPRRRVHPAECPRRVAATNVNGRLAASGVCGDHACRARRISASSTSTRSGAMATCAAGTAEAISSGYTHADSGRDASQRDPRAVSSARRRRG